MTTKKNKTPVVGLVRHEPPPRTTIKTIEFTHEQESALLEAQPVKRLRRDAMDDSAEHLKAADHNYRLLRDEWCECNSALDHIVYYRSAKSGSHGWMCVDCNGIVQTG
jgi:hypothetical protein